MEAIETRHTRSCPAASDAARRCSCSPSYRATVWSARDRKVIRSQWSRDLDATKGWRDDARQAARKGTLRVPAATTIREAGAALLAGIRDGSVRTRSGDPYKPAAARAYERDLRLRVYPELGSMRLVEVRRSDLQALADRLLVAGLDPSTIRGAFMPLRVIYRRAIARDEVAVNPTTGLELPAVRGRRERIASRGEAAALLEALPAGDRALWATAFYGGLRRGELRALRWEDVDLASGVIRVRRSWDQQAGAVDPKSRAGRRAVPIPAALRDHLLEHRIATDHPAGLVFGRSAELPFDPSTVTERAGRAWRADGLGPIGLHEARHTFASLMIAAGVNAKALSTFMGHSSITTTVDRYGHLMPGGEGEAAALLDVYLAQREMAAHEAARRAVPA
jgi:integrase